LYPQEKKRKQQKPPDLEILVIKGQRIPERVAIDGRVKNTGVKPIEGLLLLIDFLSSDNVLLTTKKGPVEAELLQPGEEAEFRLEVGDPVRSVRFRVNAENSEGRDLRVENNGPFVIE
jgi:hypothetical protein